MDDTLLVQSPRNIRNLNLAIGEAVLRILQENENQMAEDKLMSEILQRAIEIDQSIEKRTGKGDETLMELRRLGLIYRERRDDSAFYNLSLEGQDSIVAINRVGRSRYFFGLLYEKEPIFRQFVDMLQRRETLTDKEAFEISGMSEPKAGFIKTILKQCPFIAEFVRSGRTSFVRYIKANIVSVAEIKKAILENYATIVGSRLFVTIDDLWNIVKVQFPDISEQAFDEAVLDLVNRHLGQVELVQGVSSPKAKLILDKRSGTYFHYLKVPKEVLEEELNHG